MRALKVLLPLFVVLALPGVARAADSYVAPSPTGNDANTCAAGSPCATIGHVVGLAGVHDGDTVHLAAGTYNEAVLTSKRLTFAGAGAGTPTSAAGSSFIHSPGTYNALNLSGGGAVQDIRLRGNDGSGTATGAMTLNSLAGTALAYSLRRVVAIGGQDTGTNASMLAVWITAQNAGSTLTSDVQDLYATSTGTLGVALQVQDATGGHDTATVTRATLVPGTNGTGLESDNGADVTMTDSAVQAATGSRAIVASGPLSLVRSSVNGGNDGLIWSGPSPLSILDSLITAAPTASSHGALDIDAVAPGTSSVLVKASTLAVKSGDASSRVVAANSQSGNTTNVQLVNSIARMLNADGSAAPGSELRTFLNAGMGTINFTASHSSFSSVNAAPGTTLPAPGSGSSVSGDPGFVSWIAGDYTLAPGPPLVDRGDPAAAAAGEIDLAGQPRSLDGNGDCTSAPDVGAFELAGQAGVTPQPVVSGPTLAPRGGPVTFTATPASGYDLAWSFSDGGTASGASVAHVFTTAGAASASVTATHLGCVGQATRSLTITTPPADRVAPILRGLKLSPRAFRALHAGGSVVVKRGTRVSFNLSERATLTFTVQRVLSGRRHGKACVKPSRRNRKAKSCHRYQRLTGSFTSAGKAGAGVLRFSGRLRGHALTPGSYRLTAVAKDAAGNKSKSATTGFQIKKPA